MYQMMSYLLFGLSMTFLFSGGQMRTFTIKNNCSFTIWPAALTDGSGTQPSNTGFELPPQASNSINAPLPWTGCKVWDRTQCSNNSSGRFTCATADCGSGQVACDCLDAVPPATYAEFFAAQLSTGQDIYDISLIDGFNLPVSITPQGGSGSFCTRTSCEANVKSVCPSELAVRGSDGDIIACDVFNQPRHCCRGEFNSLVRCQPTNYSSIFKNQCLEAYSYLYDGQASSFACDGGPNYLITFCP